VCAVTSVFRPLLRWVARLRFDTPALGIALKLAYGVVVCELLAISFIRYRFTGGKLTNAIVQVVIGSGIAFAIGFGRIGVS
jgi:hypothetical protein